MKKITTITVFLFFATVIYSQSSLYSEENSLTAPKEGKEISYYRGGGERRSDQDYRPESNYRGGERNPTENNMEHPYDRGAVRGYEAGSQNSNQNYQNQAPVYVIPDDPGVTVYPPPN